MNGNSCDLCAVTAVARTKNSFCTFLFYAFLDSDKMEILSLILTVYIYRILNVRMSTIESSKYNFN